MTEHVCRCRFGLPVHAVVRLEHWALLLLLLPELLAEGRLGAARHGREHVLQLRARVLLLMLHLGAAIVRSGSPKRIEIEHILVLVLRGIRLLDRPLLLLRGGKHLARRLLAVKLGLIEYLLLWGQLGLRLRLIVELSLVVRR